MRRKFAFIVSVLVLLTSLISCQKDPGEMTEQEKVSYFIEYITSARHADMKKLLTVTNEILSYENFNELVEASGYDFNSSDSSYYGMSEYHDYVYISAACTFVSFSMYLDDMRMLHNSFDEIYQRVMSINDGAYAFETMFSDKMYAIGEKISDENLVEFANLLDNNVGKCLSEQCKYENYCMQYICYSYTADTDRLDEILQKLGS